MQSNCCVHIIITCTYKKHCYYITSPSRRIFNSGGVEVHTNHCCHSSALQASYSSHCIYDIIIISLYTIRRHRSLHTQYTQPVLIAVSLCIHVRVRRVICVRTLVVSRITLQACSGDAVQGHSSIHLANCEGRVYVQYRPGDIVRTYIIV